MPDAPSIGGQSGETDLLMEIWEKEIISDQPFALDKGLLWTPGLSVNLRVKRGIDFVIRRHKRHHLVKRPAKNGPRCLNGFLELCEHCLASSRRARARCLGNSPLQS